MHCFFELAASCQPLDPNSDDLVGPKLRRVKISRVVPSDSCKIHQSAVLAWHFFVLESTMIYVASCLFIISCQCSYNVSC